MWGKMYIAGVQKTLKDHEIPDSNILFIWGLSCSYTDCRRNKQLNFD